MSHDRDVLMQLAELRLEEAILLLNNGHPSGAYYLAGYAIECALKAKIASQFRANEIPDRDLVNKIYKHDFGELLSLANLKEQLNDAMTGDARLRRHWTIIAKWNSNSRYNVKSAEDATALLDAVGGNEGLMQWLRSRW